LININVTACMSSAVGFYILWQHIIWLFHANT